MAWKVRIPDRTLRLLRAKFPPADVALVEHLQRLELNPEIAQPIETGPYAGLRTYQFRLERPPGTVQLTAFMRLEPEQRIVEILTFGIMRGDPPQIVEYVD